MPQSMFCGKGKISRIAESNARQGHPCRNCAIFYVANLHKYPVNVPQNRDRICIHYYFMSLVYLPGLPISPAFGDHARHVVLAVAFIVCPAAVHYLLKWEELFLSSYLSNHIFQKVSQRSHAYCGWCQGISNTTTPEIAYRVTGYRVKSFIG